jgi:sulfur-carrier protein adenylyltransferase/sulfurtransferase
MSDYRDLVERARREVDEMDPAAVRAGLADLVLIDIREADEYSGGVIPGAILLPRGLIERDIARVVPDRARRLVVYCESGWRSVLAARTLAELGYDAASMRGGFDEWKRLGFPWGDPGGLTREQRRRYARHVRLPEVGEAGQVKLLSSRVLLVGAGGLGSPAALYMAAAGVGTIGVVDDDRVDQSNLQRQVLHTIDRVGMPKVDSAREAISALNPDVKVEAHPVRLDASNAVGIVAAYDVIVDGGDNFPTRYLLNDAALHARVPVVHGSIYRFEGQVSVFDPYEGPCYRCLHRRAPAPEAAPSCAEAGVLGVLPGVVGSIQAMEAIKLLLDLGNGLRGRLLVYDALEQDITLLPIARDPDCPACSDPSRPPRIVDYDETCVSAR